SSSVSSILSTVLFLPRFSLFVSFFFLQCYGDHRDLHSFPTRRSSDLGTLPVRKDHPHLNFCQLYGMGDDITFNLAAEGYNVAKRSEEHTSELQSRENLVCRLLLEKKKANARRREARSKGQDVADSYSR